jgi:hypothetical protein
VNATKSFLSLSAAGALLLAGCGGSTPSSTSVEQPETDVGGLDDSSTEPAAPADADSDAANIDVCSLLSEEEAAATARAHGLNGAQTEATVYTLTATPQTDTGIEPSSSCKFHIDGQGAEGTVVIQIQSADGFDLYSSGTKVPDVGDEAYSVQGSTVVRVGGLMLSAGENSFTDEFVVDLYRKMVPDLK